jgi:hypothetical protein
MSAVSCPVLIVTFNVMFIVLALVACLIGRARVTPPDRLLYNLSVRDEARSNPIRSPMSEDGSEMGKATFLGKLREKFW